MTPLEQLKRELERFGAEHDAVTAERGARMLNITRDTGELLAVLVQATAARRILEVGTSNGYSTLWLAEAARRTGGRVLTLEYAAHKHRLAQANFAAAGLEALIEARCADAGQVLPELAPAGQDLIFLDSDRARYLDWWPWLKRALRPGGLLVVDNAISHQAQLADFSRTLAADPDFSSCLVPVGKGELLATRAPA
ncbi:O-methyltransferase [Zobellella sp. An-6]|uniref:O-methyltransferase n=1 Tax=Zobellella sp. An-6 TaxID=3400218 RepID=UPI004041061B